MKAASFQYHAPTTVEEVVGDLEELGDDAKLIGGGQSLIPVLAMRLTRFEHLIDLNQIEDLNYISPDDDSINIGAITRQATVEHSPLIAESIPLLSRAIPSIGHFQIRNRGTVCGSLAHGDPASELPAVATTLGAEMYLLSHRGLRTVPASEFFLSTWETAVEPDELVQSVTFPVWQGRVGFGFEEFALRTGDFAITGATCAVALDGNDVVQRVGIALMGMDARPLKAAAAEVAVLGTALHDIDVNEIARIAIAESNPSDDLHGSAQYRKQVCTVLLRRAFRAALDEASNA